MSLLSKSFNSRYWYLAGILFLIDLNGGDAQSPKDQSALNLKKTPIAPEYIQDYSAGNEALRLKNYAKAKEFFEKALEGDPNYPDALTGLGRVYFEMAKENLDQARQLFKKTIYIDGEHAQAIELEGEYLLMVGKVKEAFNNYQTLKKISPIEADDLKISLDPILLESQEVLKKYNPKTLSKRIK